MKRRCSQYFRSSLKEVSRFWRARSGATAVEFALIAPLLIGLIVAVLETTLFLFAQANLQAAATQAGRLVMTGQVQTAAMTQTQFLNAICPSVQALFTCSSLMVDVQSYAAFSAANAAAPTLTYNAQGQVTNNWNYNPGTQGQIVVVRLMYQWQVMNGPLGFVFANMSNGTSLITGVSAFRVEPY